MPRRALDDNVLAVEFKQRAIAGVTGGCFEQWLADLLSWFWEPLY
ncbi:MAG TPA: hypothetical protein VHR45_00685 [Thermoanaerobaculia bacterium]|nr:hypothetical protein [Thermoanaerobaculia bacterium]